MGPVCPAQRLRDGSERSGAVAAFTAAIEARDTAEDIVEATHSGRLGFLEQPVSFPE